MWLAPSLPANVTREQQLSIIGEMADEGNKEDAGRKLLRVFF
jgi:hypothetical protein